MPELASEPRALTGRSRRPDPQQGIFETMLVVDGRPIELDAHLARLEASLAELFPGRPTPNLSDVPGFRGRYGYSTTGTSGLVQLRDAALGSMRITVAPSGDGGLDAQVAIRAIDPKLVLAPSRVPLSSLPLAGGLGRHKWADRSLLDQAQSDLPADTLPLLVDRDGTVLEASRANVFVVRDGTLVTPPADDRILPGVTRMRVIEIADTMGIRTYEAQLSRDDLLAADDVFLTGSVRGVEQVSAIDEIELQAEGEVGASIATELRRAWLDGRFG